MKFRRTLLGLAAGRRRPRRLLGAAAIAQAAYKAEYKMSLVLGPPSPWGKGGEIWADLVKRAHPGPHQHQAVPRRLADPGRPDARVQRAAPGRDRHGRRLDHQLVAAGQAAEPVLAALPDARLRGDRRADAGRGRQGDLRRRSTRPAWCRWPGARTATARSPTPSKPIKSPDDLKGLKIRVVGSPLFLDTFTALGANPTQMSWADAQPALASGAVDGQENPMSLFTVLPSCTPWARSS